MSFARQVMLVAMLTLGTVRAATPNPGPLDLSDVPQFNGYIGIGQDARFAVSMVRPDGGTSKLAWVKIGQRFGRYTIMSFDPVAETLKLAKPGFAAVTIKLIEGKVHTAPVTAVSRADARKYAFDTIANYVKSSRARFPDRSVTVNPDVALMADAWRAPFLERKRQLEENGQWLTPFVLADGRWGTSLSGNEAAKLPAEIHAALAEDDCREINQAWALARAEATARSIVPKVATPAR